RDGPRALVAAVGPTRTAPVRGALLAVLVGTACGRSLPPPATAASVALVEAPTWTRLQAQHRVRLTVSLDDGKKDVRTLRGLIAVERPARFRLRALGP